MHRAKFILTASGVLLFAFGLAGVIQALFLSGAFFVLAYAIHLRLGAVWWIGCVFFLCGVPWSIWILIVGPRSEFILLDVLGTLLCICAAFWWWKQKSYFVRSD